MTDTTINTTPDSFGRGNSNGYIADISALSAVFNSKDVSAKLDVLNNALSDDFNHLDMGIAGVARDIVDNRAQLVQAISNGNGALGIQAERIGAAVGVQNEKIGSAIGIQNEKIATDSQVQVEKVAAALALQIEKTTSAQELQAEKLAAAANLQAERISSANVLLMHQIAATAAAKQAECCCEIQKSLCHTNEHIDHSAGETRHLIAELARRDCDRRETDLKIDLSNKSQSEHLRHMLDDILDKRHHNCCDHGHQGHGYHNYNHGFPYPFPFPYPTPGPNPNPPTKA